MRRLLIFSALVCLALNMIPLKAGLTQEEPLQSGLVSLDFEEADIRDVMKVIAMASDLNLVIGQDVQAKVTISLKDVPWEYALDVILRTYNFTYKREANLIRIMTFEKVKQEERDTPLSTRIVYLNFAEVVQLRTTLEKMLSDRGTIETDARTNSMLITDVPDKLDEAEKIAKQLDTRTPQVLIEAMLVDVKLTKDDELGINWEILHVDRHDPWQGKTSSNNYIEQPSGMSSLSGEAIKFGWLQRMGTFRLDGLIAAWVQDAKANILASPKIVTLDNQTAKIEIKSQVAYTQHTTTEQGSTTSTQFKDVVTGLQVTPHITKEGFVSMSVKPKQEFVEAFSSDGQPQIGSRSAETNVLIKDGQTIVIGGLRKVEDSATITKVPILGDIPFIGGIFRKKNVQKINTELVMFVTPHIVVHPELTEEDQNRLEMLDQVRADFLAQQEKEREKRLRQGRKQVRLLEPEPFAEGALESGAYDWEPLAETGFPEAEELPFPEPEDPKGYIYSW